MTNFFEDFIEGSYFLIIKEIDKKVSKNDNEMLVIKYNYGSDNLLYQYIVSGYGEFHIKTLLDNFKIPRAKKEGFNLWDCNIDALIDKPVFADIVIKNGFPVFKLCTAPSEIINMEFMNNYTINKNKKENKTEDAIDKISF